MDSTVSTQIPTQTYINQHKVLKSTDFNIFPPWYHLQKEQRMITPELCKLPEPYVGFHFTLSSSIEMTAQKILQEVPINKVSLSKSLFMKIKFGFPGSGSHAIYLQLNNENTNNIILTVFCPLDISNEIGCILWEKSHQIAQLVINQWLYKWAKNLQNP